MSDIEFEEVVEKALQLSPAEQARLMERLAASMRAVLDADTPQEDEAPWTPEELAELMKIEPLPPAEVIARGLLGTWSDLGITDGAEWVNEQKRKRRERKKFTW